MFKGTVKFFNESKGLGCITDSSTGEDVFFRSSGLRSHVIEGDTVTFDKERGKKGTNAINITRG
jgi:cold shock protein